MKRQKGSTNRYKGQIKFYDSYSMSGDEEKSSVGIVPEDLTHAQRVGEVPDKSGNSGSKNVVRCSVCDVDAVKYTCPGCGRKSCSLPCVQGTARVFEKICLFFVCMLLTAGIISCTSWLLAEHKSRFVCNGKRNRTEFVKRGAMSDDTLRSGMMKM